MGKRTRETMMKRILKEDNDKDENNKKTKRER